MWARDRREIAECQSRAARFREGGRSGRDSSAERARSLLPSRPVAMMEKSRDRSPRHKNLLDGALAIIADSLERRYGVGRRIARARLAINRVEAIVDRPRHHHPARQDPSPRKNLSVPQEGATDRLASPTDVIASSVSLAAGNFSKQRADINRRSRAPVRMMRSDRSESVGNSSRCRRGEIRGDERAGKTVAFSERRRRETRGFSRHHVLRGGFNAKWMLQPRRTPT